MLFSERTRQVKIKLLETAGKTPALFGLGKSFGKTSGMAYKFFEFEDEPRKSLFERAKKLLPMGGGHNQFAKMIFYWFEIQAPRYFWSEHDTYKVGVAGMSESTMHTVGNRKLTKNDFEDQQIERGQLEYLNAWIECYQKFKDKRKEALIIIKRALPEGFLQTRVVCYSLMAMQNIVKQRTGHRLPEWKVVCDEFSRALEAWR